MVSIIIALLIVIFAVQNSAIVPVQFLGWATDLPLVLVIFCSVFAGALLMFFLAMWRELKHRMGKRTAGGNAKAPASVNTQQSAVEPALSSAEKDCAAESNVKE